MGWGTSNNMDSDPGHGPGSMTWANKTIGVGPPKNVKKTRKSQKCPNLTAQNPPVSYIHYELAFCHRSGEAQNQGTYRFPMELMSRNSIICLGTVPTNACPDCEYL